jgi:hypothetical protein
VSDDLQTQANEWVAQAVQDRSDAFVAELATAKDAILWAATADPIGAPYFVAWAIAGLTNIAQSETGDERLTGSVTRSIAALNDAIEQELVRRFESPDAPMP